MLDGLRRRASYANVMSTIAVFAVLAGGGAWAAQKIGPKEIKGNAVRAKHVKKNQIRAKHIKGNQVRGRHVKEASLRGVGLGVLGGEWDALGQDTSGRALSSVGGGVASGANAVLAPLRFRARQFRVSLATAQGAGTRTFYARVDGALNTLCTISVGGDSCASQAVITVPAGARFDFYVTGSGVMPNTSAHFGWRAVR